MDDKPPKGWIKCKNTSSDDVYFNIATISAVVPWDATSASIHFDGQKLVVEANADAVMALIGDALHLE